jgi:hypothetical protein
MIDDRTFDFIDAVIHKDYKTATSIALDIEQGEQISLLTLNGYITPCPYREDCATYKVSDGVRPDGTTYSRGCDGSCYWCGRHDR